MDNWSKNFQNNDVITKFVMWEIIVHTSQVAQNFHKLHRSGHKTKMNENDKIFQGILVQATAELYMVKKMQKKKNTGSHFWGNGKTIKLLYRPTW